MLLWRKLRYRLRPRKLWFVRRRHKLSVGLTWTESYGKGLNQVGWVVSARVPDGNWVDLALFRFWIQAFALFAAVNLVEMISPADRREQT